MITYTRAEDVANDLAARLSTIQTAQGAETDIGVTLFKGRRKVAEGSEMPCAMLIEGMDVPTQNGPMLNAKIAQPFVVWGFMACDPNNPNVVAHKMIRDIKRAIFKDDATLGKRVYSVEYKGKVIEPRAEGSNAVQVAVAIEVQWAERLSEP